MSTADDSGEVHVSEFVPFKYSQQSPDAITATDAHTVSTIIPSIQTQHKTLHHAGPETFAITSCSVFRPRVNDLYLASGGTDCMVKLWDVMKPR